VVDEDQDNLPLARLHAHAESVARRDAHRRSVEEVMRFKCSYAGDVLEAALTQGHREIL